jgi:hypothetical protein
MMKNYLKKFDWWYNDFSKRMKKWLIPLVQEGLSVRDIYARLMNRFSTEKSLKLHSRKSLKLHTIKPSGIHEDFVYKSNTEPALPYVQGLLDLGSHLKGRFSLREGDVNMLMKSFSLNHHKRATNLYELWLKRGISPQSPIRLYQTCLNKTRNEKWVFS